MLFRTLEVPDTQGQLLNAVVLCGFTATRINRQFLVYSLNEKSGEGLVKTYLTPLEGEDQELRMCDAPPEILTAAAQVLKDIFSDACVSDEKQTVGAYILMDLTKTNIQCSAVDTHYSLKVSEAWITSLLQYNSKPEISTRPLASQNTDNCAPLEVPATRSLTDEAGAIVHAQTNSEKIEANLKSLITTITNHKETLLGKYVRLDERQLELEQLTQELLIRELTLNQREDELTKSIRSLQDAEKQLNAILEN